MFVKITFGPVLNGKLNFALKLLSFQIEFFQRYSKAAEMVNFKYDPFIRLAYEAKSENVY